MPAARQDGRGADPTSALRSRAGLAALLMLLVGGIATPARAWVETVLQNFTNGSDGGYPSAGLSLDASGALYGTTPNGGVRGFGTVFQLMPGQSPRVVYSFSGGADGGYPLAGVVAAGPGKLYGTTLSGGAYGQGTVFELSAPGGPAGGWAERVLYSFRGDADGGSPTAGVAIGPDGALYGTTVSGGAHGLGAVFKLTPTAGGAAVESVLHSFAGHGDGELPFAGVAFAGGWLYGTTSYGGAHAFGTVFRLSPAAGSEQVLYSFTGKVDGALPAAGLVPDAAGALYGTTRWGGAYASGTAFKLMPAAGGGWSEIVLHSFGNAFSSGDDGGSPIAGLILDAAGGLYGTTDRGGAHGQGTVFKLTPASASGSAWSAAVLHSFSGADGDSPKGGLVLTAGRLFGTTFRGGARDVGTIFQLSP